MSFLSNLFGKSAPQNPPTPPPMSSEQQAQILFEKARQLVESDNAQSKREGLLALTEVAKLDPNHFGAHLALARFSYASDALDADMCMHWSTRTHEINPSDPAARTSLAFAHYKKGQEFWEAEDWINAFERYKTAIEYFTPGEARDLMFTLLSVTAEPERADCQDEFVAIAANLIRENPDDNEKRYTLGMTLFEMKRYNEALASLMEYSQRNRQSPAGHYGLAKIYLAIGNDSAAHDELDILKRLDPEKAASLEDIIG